VEDGTAVFVLGIFEEDAVAEFAAVELGEEGLMVAVENNGLGDAMSVGVAGATEVLAAASEPGVEPDVVAEAAGPIFAFL
jgi:hypothetical protein